MAEILHLVGSHSPKVQYSYQLKSKELTNNSISFTKTTINPTFTDDNTDYYVVWLMCKIILFLTRLQI